MYVLCDTLKCNFKCKNCNTKKSIYGNVWKKIKAELRKKTKTIHAFDGKRTNKNKCGKYLTTEFIKMITKTLGKHDERIKKYKKVN